MYPLFRQNRETLVFTCLCDQPQTLMKLARLTQESTYERLSKTDFVYLVTLGPKTISFGHYTIGKFSAEPFKFARNTKYLLFTPQISTT